MEPSTSKFCYYDVGGEVKKFARTTIMQPHLEGSVLRNTMTGVYGDDETPYLEVNPDFFDKWIDPYIRHEVFPTSIDLTSCHDRNHLIRAANSIGLIALGLHVQEKIIDRKFDLFFSSRSFRLKQYSVRSFSLAEISDLKKHCKIRFPFWNNNQDPKKISRVYGDASDDSEAILMDEETKEKFWNSAVFLYKHSYLKDNDTMESAGIEPGGEIVIELHWPA